MSIFAVTVRRLVEDEGYSWSEARQAAANDLLDSKWADLLTNDPDYQAWARKQDRADRRFHEEHDR